MRTYTIIGFWPDSGQRFCTVVEASSPSEAEVHCGLVHEGIAICGVIAGRHECVDTNELVEYTGGEQQVHE